MALATGAWVAGFDILYACQDLEFDRAQGLRSIPARSVFESRWGSHAGYTWPPWRRWRRWRWSRRSAAGTSPGWPV